MKTNRNELGKTTFLDAQEAKHSWSGPGADLELIFAQRAEELARLRRRPERGREHLLFTLGRATFAVDLTFVISVIAPRFKTVLPGAPPHLAEVAEVAGRFIALFRLDHFLDLTTHQDPPTKYLVLDYQGRRLGLSIHGFLAVENLAPEDLTPVEPQDGGDLFKGMTTKMTLVLDGARLFETIHFEG